MSAVHCKEIMHPIWIGNDIDPEVATENASFHRDIGFSNDVTEARRYLIGLIFRDAPQAFTSLEDEFHHESLCIDAEQLPSMAPLASSNSCPI